MLKSPGFLSQTHESHSGAPQLPAFASIHSSGDRARPCARLVRPDSGASPLCGPRPLRATDGRCGGTASKSCTGDGRLSHALGSSSAGLGRGGVSRARVHQGPKPHPHMCPYTQFGPRGVCVCGVWSPKPRGRMLGLYCWAPPANHPWSSASWYQPPPPGGGGACAAI